MYLGAINGKTHNLVQINFDHSEYQFKINMKV